MVLSGCLLLEMQHLVLCGMWPDLFDIYAVGFTGDYYQGSDGFTYISTHSRYGLACVTAAAFFRVPPENQ